MGAERLAAGELTETPQPLAAAAQWAFEQPGGVDVLVNNFGDMASGQASWTEVTEAAIDPVLAVDIKGTMSMVREFGQRMVAGGGAIVNVGSTVIVRGSPRAPQYAAGTYGLPAGKIPGPEDMTGAALFLASGDAHHVTGSYMIADGGYSMLGA